MTQNNKEIAVAHVGAGSVFASELAFAQAEKMCTQLVKSKLVPADYQGEGNIPNAMIALEMANRMNISPLMIMQNLDIIKGRPAFNSKFTMAMVAATGKYSALRFEVEELGLVSLKWNETTWENGNRTSKPMEAKFDNKRVRAWCIERSTNEKLVGNWVSMEMAYREGWFSKEGSKWRTMPDQMLVYRAGKFWANQYEPGITMGLPTSDELEDIKFEDVTVKTQTPVQAANDEIASKAKTRTRKNAQVQNETPIQEATVITETGSDIPPEQEESPFGPPTGDEDHMM